MEHVQLICDDNGDIQLYKKLILQRDKLKKEEVHIWLEYVKEFGELLEKSLNLQAECIKYKKTIAYCQSHVNRGIKIEAAELDNYIEREMEGYYKEIKEISQARQAKTSPVSEYDFLRIKKMYREIATAIHPDLHPDLKFDMKLSELWEKAKAAYDNNDLSGLKEVKLLLADYLANPTLSDDLDEQQLKNLIYKTRNEIEDILNSVAYRYKDILMDDVLCEEKRGQLSDEIEEFIIYRAQLLEKLKEYDITEDLN